MSTNQLLGPGNTLLSYLLVLVVYGGMAVVMRHSGSRVEPGFRKTFWLLFAVYAVLIFAANYLLFLAGAMSFLPWLNNFLHTFVWIGLCLSYLYAGCYNRPVVTQFVLFFAFSLAVKLAEQRVLGTWEQDNWFGIPGNLAYLFGWSLFDGLTPIGSLLGLRVVGRFAKGLVMPRPRLT